MAFAFIVSAKWTSDDKPVDPIAFRIEETNQCMELEGKGVWKNGPTGVSRGSSGFGNECTGPLVVSNRVVARLSSENIHQLLRHT